MGPAARSLTANDAMVGTANAAPATIRLSKARFSTSSPASASSNLLLAISLLEVPTAHFAHVTRSFVTTWYLASRRYDHRNCLRCRPSGLDRAERGHRHRADCRDRRHDGRRTGRPGGRQVTDGERGDGGDREGSTGNDPLE